MSNEQAQRAAGDWWLGGADLQRGPRVQTNSIFASK